ncbi:MAG: hypothetical protein H2048_09235 [Erythrobacter sp.]|nr:hypothetical protein [Erythrobacter sp.]
MNQRQLSGDIRDHADGRYGAQSCRAILSPWIKILLFISAIFESSQSALYAAHSVAVAFFSEQVLGIEGLSDRTFDDLLERRDDCGCVDAPSIGKAVLAIVRSQSRL